MAYKRIPLVFLLLLPFFFAGLGCQSAPKEGAAVNEAQWESRLKVKDLAKNKSQSISVDILGRRSSGEVRMEMSAVLGIPVASYVMDGKGFSAALYRQKQFYQGPLSEEALQPVIRLPLSPLVFRQIIFDEPIRGGDWSCDRGGDGLVSACRSPSRRLDIQWERKDGEKTAKIRHPSFEIDWLFEVPSTEVQFKPGTFHLKAPKGFRLIRL